MAQHPDPIYLDNAVIVAEKPSGLLSVPGRGDDKQDCLARRLAARWPDAEIVHRLDMATSGLMLFARGKAMQQQLSCAFAERRIGKRYTAVVAGHPASGEGEIDLPLMTDWPARPRQKIDLAAGKPALTRYQVIHQEADRCRLSLEPVTGRTHQLRVHLWAIGHPILGDALYAPDAWRDCVPRLQLHAESLSFVHPLTGEAMSFHSEAPF